MKDFLYFEDWFSKNFRVKMDSRYFTLKAGLNLFLQRGGNLILETGCMRIKDDWGGGCSTLLFATVCARYDKRMISVDISEANLRLSDEVTHHLDDDAERRITLYCADSQHFLEQYDPTKSPMGIIDLLYLDSLDCAPGDIHSTYRAQRHQLREIQLAHPHLSDKAVVLLDDVNHPWGGKGFLAKEFLYDNGFELVLEFQQSLWARTP